jgi:hypothetical protein
MNDLRDRLDRLSMELTHGVTAPPVAAVRRRALRRRALHAVATGALALWIVWLVTLPGLGADRGPVPGPAGSPGADFSVPVAGEGEVVIRLKGPRAGLPAELRARAFCEASGARLVAAPQRGRMVAHGQSGSLLLYEVSFMLDTLRGSSARWDADHPQPPMATMIQVFERRTPGDSRMRSETRLVVDGASTRLTRQGGLRVALVGTYGVVDHQPGARGVVRQGASGRIAASWWCRP